ncbi:MAG: hypothetical protein ABI605_20065 [Rhizobacter sp.]
MSIVVLLVASIAVLPSFALATWLWLEVTGQSDELSSLAKGSQGMDLTH